jgi:hypothetical protein
MKCSDVERVLPDVIDGEGDAEFQLHLQSCPACAELAAELKLIISEAQELTEIAEPPARVWVGIANQLRAEGIIREPEAVPGRPVLVPTPTRRWNTWWLAPVAAAILAVGSYQLTHQKTLPATQQTAQQPLAQPTTAGSQMAGIAANQSAGRPSEPRESSPIRESAQVAQHRALPPTVPAAEAKVARNSKVAPVISAPPSVADEQFLSEVSERAPGMRATYENQLRAVNAEIRETQAYIKRFPGDADARQHLMEVYQQKALLYRMALDRIQ